MKKIAEFAVKSTICYGQFASNPVISRLSTLVGRDPCDNTAPVPVRWNRVICPSDAVAEKHVCEGMRVYEEFISEDEETSLLSEIEPYLKRLKYEHDHWDDVSVFSINITVQWHLCTLAPQCISDII